MVDAFAFEFKNGFFFLPRYPASTDPNLLLLVCYVDSDRYPI